MPATGDDEVDADVNAALTEVRYAGAVAVRAVVDTNILVRATIKPNGSVGPVLQRLRRRGIPCY